MIWRRRFQQVSASPLFCVFDIHYSLSLFSFFFSSFLVVRTKIVGVPAAVLGLASLTHLLRVPTVHTNGWPTLSMWRWSISMVILHNSVTFPSFRRVSPVLEWPFAIAMGSDHTVGGELLNYDLIYKTKQSFRFRPIALIHFPPRSIKEGGWGWLSSPAIIYLPLLFFSPETEINAIFKLESMGTDWTGNG